MQIQGFPIGVDNFYVRTIDPWSVSFQDLLVFTRISLDSFQDNGLARYFRSGRYPMVLTTENVNRIKQPILRLNECIGQAQRFRQFNYSYARYLHLMMLNSRGLVSALCERSDEGDETIVGLCCVSYPGYMRPSYGGINEVLFRAFTWWKRLVYKVQDWFSYSTSGGENPMDNSRIGDFLADYNQLAFSAVGLPEPDLYRIMMPTMSSTELRTAPYQKSDMVVIYSLVISPDYQSKGLGTRFLRTVLDQVPNVPIIFTSSDGEHKSVGPQKFYVNSSSVARQVYIKCGFSVTYIYERLLQGYEADMTRMDMARMLP
jgi:GNAT superfamily N-acetyltransferase